MRVALLATLALTMLLSAGCRHHNVCRNGCRSNAHVHHGHQGHHGFGAVRPTRVAPLPAGYMNYQFNGPPGPPVGAYAYPYYTTRAPRDFLMDNPPSIGP